jgi:uncharacterized protein YecE (DUF72 family)
MRHPEIFIGTAGWAIRKEHADHFSEDGSHLERYAARLNAVEINSSFYRPHRPATYARWASSVPEGFRFSVKVPREISHKRRLVDTSELLDRFLSDCQELGSKLGPLLVQLPPSFIFRSEVVEAFLEALRQRFDGSVVWEPRHKTWFDGAADRLLIEYHVARVAADPAVVPVAAQPGGWRSLVYYRLHGAPQIYYSNYSQAFLETLRQTLLEEAEHTAAWCIFDNTALGHATANARACQQLCESALTKAC